jgi:hypothetical protein
VTVWKTRAYCVWLVETFRAMTWKYKTLYLGGALSPLLISLAARLRADVPWDPFLRVLLWAVAGMSWVYLGLDVANYVRGYRAIRRGVAPQPPNKRPTVASPWFLIMSAAMVCLCLLTGLSRAWTHRAYHWYLFMSLLWLGMLLTQLQAYARDRQWHVPADFHGQLLNG